MREEIEQADRILICASPDYNSNEYLTKVGDVRGSGSEIRFLQDAIPAKRRKFGDVVVAVSRGSPDYRPFRVSSASARR